MANDLGSAESSKILEASHLMEEKRADLRSERQRKLLQTLVEELGRVHPQFYYLSTIEVARALKSYIAEEAQLTQDDRALLDGLKPDDIQILLGLH